MNLFKKKFLIIILGILILGSLLRFYKLGEKSFVADEFLGVNTTYGYLQTGQWLRWDFNLEKPYQDKPYFKTFFDLDFWNGGENTYTRAWMYNWQVAQSLKLFPDDKEWSYRVVSAIWGIIGILIIYIVAAKMSGRREIGLITALLLALSIDSIDFSRKIRMYIMFMPVFLLFFYYAFNFIESKRKVKLKIINDLNEKTGLNFYFLLPTALLGILSMHLHLLAANFVFIIIAYFVVMGIITYRKEQKINNKYLLYLLCAIIIGWIMSIFTKALLSGINLENHFSYFAKSFTDYSNPLIAILLMLGGAYFLIKHKLEEGVFIITAYLTILLAAAFLWDRSAGPQYLFFAKPFQIMLIAAGIWAVVTFLKENLKAYNTKIYVFSLAVLLLIVPNFTYFFQEENVYTQTSASDNPNYKKVFAYFTKEKGTNDVLVSRNFRNFYWRGSKTETYSLGGERADEEEKKITKERLQSIITSNDSGWIIYSENDENFISKEAEAFMMTELERVSNINVRGPITVYRWR